MDYPDIYGMKALKVLIVILLVWAIIATGALAYYYNNYVYYYEFYNKIKGKFVEVKLLLDYGNGSITWYNNSLIPLGSSLLDLTRLVVDVNYTIGQYGAFVNGINGVFNDKSKNRYWIYWIWKDKKWVLGELASDKQLITPGGIYAWKYSDTSKWPPEPPG